MDVTIGELIDKKYRIVRLLGEGGMGAVYEGENIRVHNRVAIKVLHANIATNQAAVDRFEREAQAAGRIGSEHICEVFDLGDLPSGARYMVMEFLDGESLSGRVTRLGRIPPVQLGQLMLQMLEGLGAAHRAGIIHRDLKPDNVFITKTKHGADFVKLVDFGVSKFNQLSGDSAMSMTRTGAVIGTPYYMSPEQAKGSKDIDHRSDLYSAGVVMFECVTGQVPFLADTFNELMFKIVLEPVPGPETIVPDLDPAFANLIKKGMAREAKDRFQSADEFMQAIGAWLSAQGVPTSMAARAPMASVPEYAVPPPSPSQPNIVAHASTQTPGLPDQLGGTANPLATSTMKPTPSSSKAGIFVAAAAALVLIGGGGFFALRGKANAGTTAPSATVATVEAPPTTTAAPTTPTTAVTPSATAAPTAPATAQGAADAAVVETAGNTPPPSEHSGRSGRRTKPTDTKPIETKPETKPTTTTVKQPNNQVGGRTIDTNL